MLSYIRDSATIVKRNVCRRIQDIHSLLWCDLRCIRDRPSATRSAGAVGYASAPPRRTP